MRPLFLLCILLTASVAGAQDPCSTALSMPCDTMNLNFNIGTGGWNSPPTVCGAPFVSCSASLFEITLASTSTLSVDIAFPGSFGVPHLYLLQDCAGLACVADTPVSGDMVWDTCLPAGTYYLVVNEPTCLFYSFTLGVSCEPCGDPVSEEAASEWGTLKTLYR
jgi:hypothetical protein